MHKKQQRSFVINKNVESNEWHRYHAKSTIKIDAILQGNHISIKGSDLYPYLAYSTFQHIELYFGFQNFTNQHITQMLKNRMPQISGYCKKCEYSHTLPAGQTEKAAQRLSKTLLQQGTIDIFSESQPKDPALCVDALFGESCGKMFGILEVLQNSGKTCFLYAFSGQYNGKWMVPGWVPPPFDTAKFHEIYDKKEQQIKAVGKEMAKLAKESPPWQNLRQQRKQFSRQLNSDVQGLCRLHNFCGETAGLVEIFGNKGIPTGTGECCTPKLLDYAARNGLTPIGLCEFFIGRATRSGSCKNGYFYAPCTSRCQPLLGFMLCGLGEKK